jgi:Ferritin-like domain
VVNGPAEEEAEPSSRRSLLRAGAAGIAGLVAVGCGSSSPPLRVQLARSPSLQRTDIEVLNRLLDVEHLGIAAYTAAVPLLEPDLGKSGSSAGTIKSWPSLFLNDELAHAGQLEGMVKAVGGEPNKPAGSYDLGHPSTSEEVLALLQEVERVQLAAYLEALPQLSLGRLRQQAVTMMANDAQHIAAVRARLGQPPVPSAFVTGRE